MRVKVLAAAELFAEYGLDGTKMEDIAAATGVPKATLYYYFDGKEAVLAFLFAEILDEVGRAVDGARYGDRPAVERLRDVVLAHLQVFVDFPAASRALQFDLGRAARIPTIAERIDGAFIGPVRELLAEGAADGSLKAVRHPGTVATAILGAVTTVGLNTLTVGRKRNVPEVADDVLDTVLLGIAT